MISSLSQKQKIIAGAGALALVVIVLAFALSGEKPTQGASQSTAGSETTATGAAIGQATAPASPKTLTGYSAECYLLNGTMLVGTVMMEDEDAPVDPSTMQAITVRNNNTGKTTDLKTSEARCTYVPQYK